MFFAIKTAAAHRVSVCALLETTYCLMLPNMHGYCYYDIIYILRPNLLKLQKQSSSLRTVLEVLTLLSTKHLTSSMLFFFPRSVHVNSD